ncbi:MAG: metallophosphoesterase, partial [Oscillospiraceae bacterium]|nr:metallophosphoesterase [Oscillospiraceae bacterium]
EYTDSQEEAEASGGRLKYIPSMKLPTFDSTKDGNYYDKADEWKDEGYPLFSWPNASLGVSGMTSTVVSAEDGEPVRFGDHSLRIDFDYSTYDKSQNANNYLRLTDDSYFFEGSPKAIGAWIYIPEGVSNFCLYLNCANANLMQVDGNGRPLATNASYAPVSIPLAGQQYENWTGWRYVEMDLYDPTVANSNNLGAANAPFGYYHGCGVFWISFQPGKGYGSKSAGTIYLDNIQLIYSANTDDTKNPEISSVTYETNSTPSELVDGQTVLTSNTVTFKAYYNDVQDKYMTGIDSGKVSMMLDGVDVTSKCFINEGDEQIHLYNAVLDNGPHSISITVYDNFGNKTTETRYFTVSGENEAKVWIEAEQKNPVLGESYSLAIKANDPSEIVGANIAVHTFAKFTSYYSNVSVEPANGFELAGEPVYDSTNATIKFSVVKNASALTNSVMGVSDDGVIARIIYNIPSDVPSDSIEVAFRLDKGEILYKSETEGNYFGSIAGRIDTECSSQLTITADTMLVGSDGGYFTVTDLSGSPVEGAYVYNSDGSLVSESATDANGKLFTDAFTKNLTSYSVYAQKDGIISFILTSQSFASGGNEDGSPTSIVLNGASDGSTMFNVSWFSSPLNSKANAVVKYALKSEYDKKGVSALTNAENGISRLEELDSTGNIETNYALRFNKATVKGLIPETEYAYIVGDGEKMSEVRYFTTGALNTDTNFFIIGDMQTEDTSNLNAILDALKNADSEFSFGIQTGDAVDNGGMYKWWKEVASIFASDYLTNMPIVHVLGNHESYGDLTGQNASDYFGMTTREDGSSPYAYSVQYGNVYIAVINYFDGTEAYQTAVQWVKNDAAKNNAQWKVLTLHQPPYYTNPGGGSGAVHDLIPGLVDESGFDFIFSGHDHSYMRTYAVTGGERDDENGAVYYICGSTGEKSYQVVEIGGYPYDFIRGSGAVEGEYDSIYLTAHTTDTEFTVYTHEVSASKNGTYTDVIIDSYTMTRPVTCTESGTHDYIYANETLTCSVCGYTRELGTYSGFATDKATGATRYFLGGSVKTGWQNYGEDVYYFNENGLAVTGSVKIDGITYKFDSKGRQIGAAFVVWEDGYTRAYRGGQYMTGWTEIDGKLYYFSTSPSYPGRMFTGVTTIRIYTGQNITYTFASDGHLLKGAFVKEEGGTVYFWGQDRLLGWHEIEGATYYFDMATGYMAVNNAVIDGKEYAFSPNGQLLHEGPHNYSYSHHQDMTCVDNDADIYYCTICGAKYEDVINKTPGHIDENNDDLCDVCGEYYKTSGVLSKLMKFFVKIRNWFRQLINWIRNLFRFSK